MTTELFRKYIDIINEADEAPGPGGAVSQQQLSQLYAKGKPMSFIKNTPVALVPFHSLEKLFGPEAAQKIAGLAGAVDKTSYDDAYRKNGYVVFQWNSAENKPDIYIASPETVSAKYKKFNGQLPTDAEARSKIPSLVVLDKMGLDANKLPFFVKTVPQQMVNVDSLGLGGKNIEVNWGKGPSTQTVQTGGYLTKNEHGMIYTVAPDAQGLPIGYITA